MNPLVGVALDVDPLVVASFVAAPLSAVTLDEAEVVVVMTILVVDALVEFRGFLAIGEIGRWLWMKEKMV